MPASSPVLSETSNRSLPLRHMALVDEMNLLHVWPTHFSNCCLCTGTWRNKFLHTSFKGRFSISYCPPALPDISPARFQSQTLCGLISLVQVPGAGQPTWSSEPSLLRRTSEAVMSLLPVGCSTADVGSGQTASPPLLSISTWLFLFIFSCGKSFLLVFRSFSEIVSLNVVAIWVCPWQEASPGSSYSAILPLLLF